MIKDLLKTMTGINNDQELNPNEKVLLSSLILYYNTSCGYAYPSYEHLMTALSTNRKSKVSTTLKSLVAKEYITIKKIKGNKSTYYINKHLYLVGAEEKAAVKKTAPKKSEKPVDSNGNAPIDNQIHVDEVINPVIIEIAEYTGFTNKQAESLLKEGRGDKAKVIIAFDHMKKQDNVKNSFKYTLWAINNQDKIIKVQEPVNEGSSLKFNNFEPRGYDYNYLEKLLTGEVEFDDVDEALRACRMHA